MHLRERDRMVAGVLIAARPQRAAFRPIISSLSGQTIHALSKGVRSS